jgi:hypothetical protein
MYSAMCWHMWRSVTYQKLFIGYHKKIETAYVFLIELAELTPRWWWVEFLECVTLSNEIPLRMAKCWLAVIVSCFLILDDRKTSYLRDSMILNVLVIDPRNLQATRRTITDKINCAPQRLSFFGPLPKLCEYILESLQVGICSCMYKYPGSVAA